MKKIKIRIQTLSKNEKMWKTTIAHTLKLAIGFVLFITMIQIVQAIPSEEWNKKYDFNRPCSFLMCYTTAYAVSKIPDGGYIVAGSTYSYDEQLLMYLNFGGFLLKTDAKGNLQWLRSIGSTLNSVHRTTDGGYIVTGNNYITVGQHDDSNIILVKTDANGNNLWIRQFGKLGNDTEPKADWANSVQQTSDGYIVAGGTDSYGAGGSDVWLIKTDNNGNKLWSKTFGGTGEDYATSIQQTLDGGYIIAGSTSSYGAGRNDAWLIKTDSLGNKQWSKTFGGTENDLASSVLQTNGNYIIAGGISDADGLIKTWLIKTDGNGNKLWSKTYGTGYISSVWQTNDGGYILAAEDIIKVDSNGNKLWNKTFVETTHSIQQTSDRGYIIAGSIDDENAFIEYARLIKLNEGITVISPNGGENWAIGSTYNISWKKYGDTGNYVKIELYKGGIYKSAISSSTLNDGSYNWTIPGIQAFGTDYKIKVTSTTNSVYTDSSDNSFAIGDTNLLKNPGFETASGTTPQYWSKYQTGTRAIFTYPETGRTVGKSVAIKYATKDVGKVALWWQKDIIVSSSKQYKLSGYMKLANVTGGGTGRLNGADLRINWYKSDGGLIKVDLITKSGTGAWTKYENTFTSPSNAVKATVGGDLFNSSGKVWFDDMEFVKIS